ncbi:MAG: circadian clock KaiB family protein [Nitrospiraceae bacterium]
MKKTQNLRRAGSAAKRSATAEFEEALHDPGVRQYLLKLYITGATTRSMRAIENIKAVCEEHLRDGYKLEIVDLYEHPQFAQENQIIAAPTLVKERPLPVRKFIGDLSNTERILSGIGTGNRPSGIGGR